MGRPQNVKNKTSYKVNCFVCDDECIKHKKVEQAVCSDSCNMKLTAMRKLIKERREVKCMLCSEHFAFNEIEKHMLSEHIKVISRYGGDRLDKTRK